MDICEIVQSWIKVHRTKKDQFLFSLSDLLCNSFSIFTSKLFYSVATHDISLFYCLKSIFSCVNIQEDILCQNAKIQDKENAYDF